MPTTVKTGWLKDKNGDKFAPKTLTSQVQTSDGVLLEDKIQSDLATAKEDILANVTIDVDSELSATSTNPVQNKVVNAEFDAISDAMGALESTINGKASSTHTHDDLYYTETEVDAFLASKADSGHTHKVTDISDLTATATELNYMDGVTSNVQNQLDSKSSSGHTHTKSEITDFPTSMKNPYALIVNGTSYTGEAPVSVNTPKAFYITVTNDGSGNYSSDKTLKEIVAAYRSNNSLFVLYDGKMFHPYEISIVDVPEVSGAVTAALTFTNNEYSQTNNIICNTYVVDLNGDYYMDNENLRVFVTTGTYEMQTQESVQVIVDSKADSMYEYIANQNSATLDEAKVYTDNAVAQKTQVQIITWGADD